MTAKSQNSSAADAAAHWLVALQDSPADADLAARFEDWLSSGEPNRQAWDEVVEINALMEEIGPRTLVSDHTNSAHPVHAAHRKRRRRRLISISAAVIGMLTLAFVFGPDLRLRMEADAMTATAEVWAEFLPDGSAMSLAPESAIAVDFSTKQREITLLKGEVYFEVEPDPARPFTVSAGTVTATAIGTAFSVRLDADGDVSVAVEHGQVEVVDAAASEPSKVLNTVEWVRTTPAGEVEQGETTAAAVAPWRENRLVVRDRPLGDVVEDLRRYYRGAIIVQDEEWTQLPVTGVYKLDDPVAALRAVAETQGGSVSRISPWVLVLSPE